MPTTNVLISGGGRGAGKAFVERYLQRPNYTVIATVRDVKHHNARSLRSLPVAQGSTLLVLKVDSTSSIDPFDAAKELEARGIDKLDMIIVNAAALGDLGPMDKIHPSKVAEVHVVNGAGPALLFMAMKPLLDRAEVPKWMAMSSTLASLEDIDKYSLIPAPPYSASKAAQNHLTRSIHFQHRNVVAFSVSPGLLDTDMGKKVAQTWGRDNLVFSDLDENVQALMGILDEATREKHSGQFLNFDREILPW